MAELRNFSLRNKTRIFKFPCKKIHSFYIQNEKFIELLHYNLKCTLHTRKIRAQILFFVASYCILIQDIDTKSCSFLVLLPIRKLFLYSSLVHLQLIKTVLSQKERPEHQCQQFCQCNFQLHDVRQVSKPILMGSDWLAGRKINLID